MSVSIELSCFKSNITNQFKNKAIYMGVSNPSPLGMEWWNGFKIAAIITVKLILFRYNIVLNLFLLSF